MDLRRAIGACLPVFFIAVLFDIAGIILLFLGIFANLRIDGRFYGDFLIYTGSIILFFSLGLWLLWYLGNVPSPYDPLTGLTKSNSIVELARKISRRLSEKLKTEVMGKGAGEDEASQAGAHKHKSGRVTWGKSTAYVNNGYEQDTWESGDGTEASVDEKKRDHNNTPVDADEEDVKAHKPESTAMANNAVDTEETSFEQ